MANKYFYEKYRLRTNDFDTLDHIYMSSILDFCQDSAGEHANELKVGFDDLYKDGRIWMVLRTKIKAIDYPPTLSSVLVKTWPLAPNRIDMDRNYLITSLDENKTYFKVVSKWIVCNISDRRLVRAKDVHFDIDSYSDEILFDEPFDKLSFDDFACEDSKLINTTYLDLDHNGHINNTKYMNFILLGVEELQNQKILEMQIDYVHELKKDFPVEIQYMRRDKTFYVKGISNGVESFLAKIEIE